MYTFQMWLLNNKNQNKKKSYTHTHTNCKNYMHVYELFGNNQNVNIHMKLIDALPFGKQTRRAIDWWVYIPEKKIHQDRLEIQAYTTLRIESVIDHFTYWLTKSWIGTSTYTWYVSSYFLFFCCCYDVKSQTVYICIQKFE